MTNHELRIAKLSKILNSKWQVNESSSPAIKEALGRVINELQKTIKTEKEFNVENEERLKIQAKIEKQEEIMKINSRKHHFSVLKKQIEDRKRQKEISYVEKLLERPKPIPKTPPDQPKFFFRENLKQQIKENKKKLKEMQKNELDMDRFMIKLANTSLEDEIKKKQQQKELVINELKQSWENTKNVNKLKKVADKLKFFGNISLQRNIKPIDLSIVKSKSKEKNNLSPTIAKKISKSYIPKTETKKADKGRTFNESPMKIGSFHKNPSHPKKLSDNVPKKELIETNKNLSPIKQDILNRLEVIRHQEEKIQNSKKEILDYLSTRAKSKG
jgi:hypothetical protein